MRYRRNRVRTWIRERRLPPGERRAAQLEREAEARIRRERDWDDPRARQIAAAEAESHRYSDYGWRG